MAGVHSCAVLLYFTIVVYGDNPHAHVVAAVTLYRITYFREIV